ncbi:ABC transporter ATP-binding protein [Brevifollis gellanilyticus]|uniref:ABC transporter ATP-binding protein n=1 Tax=Brevifollis gellanilyticus TaxID=748831 RepID=A0A512M9B3_9BACT|nr:ABC transporter ATP-binding protein [Brevifollis gellanilyticus]GEP43293.1 ABC transporter ATP-binding protein [Brevifollis gellanilyticus]
MPGITVSNLHFAYPGSPFRLRVEGLEVAEGGSLALLGPSGAGKTTLLRLMSGLVEPEKGTVKLGDQTLTGLSEAQRRAFRLSQIGLVFQDFALLDYLTVEENVLLPQRFRGGAALSEVALELAEKLEIRPHWKKLASQLSQGERQRVAIARALVHQPRFLFADEPTASLDAKRREIVIELLQDYSRKHGACLVIVTHDTDLIPRFPQHARVEDFTSSSS